MKDLSETDHTEVVRAAGVGAQQDWIALAGYLEKHGLRFEPENTPRLFKGGYGNLNYLIRINDAWAVLRRPPSGPTPANANDMAREHNVLSVLAPVLPFAPRALHYCQDSTVIGAPFLLSEFRAGRPLHGSQPLHNMTPDVSEGLSRMQIAVLAALHWLDPEHIGAMTLGRVGGFAARTTAGWAKRLDAASETPPQVARHLFDWLQANQPETEIVRVIHNDFKLDNILVDPKHPLEPIALLDWDMATLGDPYFDLATLLSYWVSPDDAQELQVINVTHSLCPGALRQAELGRLYAAETGAPLDIDRLRFFLGLAHAKLGVVLMQLHNRYLRNPELGDRFARTGPAIIPAFEKGLAATTDPMTDWMTS